MGYHSDLVGTLTIKKGITKELTDVLEEYNIEHNDNGDGTLTIQDMGAKHTPHWVKIVYDELAKYGAEGHLIEIGEDYTIWFTYFGNNKWIVDDAVSPNNKLLNTDSKTAKNTFKKITEGYVEQVFSNKGELISQKFIAGDDCSYENENGETIKDLNYIQSNAYHEYRMYNP